MKKGLIILTAGALLMPSTALADNGKHKSAKNTFPVASGLCKHASQNKKMPKNLSNDREDVVKACNTLQESYDKTKTSFDTTKKELKTQKEVIKATVAASCTLTSSKETCKAAKIKAKEDIKNLQEQFKVANKTYHTDIQTARSTFWSTIKTLKQT